MLTIIDGPLLFLFILILNYAILIFYLETKNLCTNLKLTMTNDHVNTLRFLHFWKEGISKAFKSKKNYLQGSFLKTKPQRKDSFAQYKGCKINTA